MASVLGLQKPSTSVIKLLAALNKVRKLDELTDLNPISPQERLAWWLRIADYYHKSNSKGSKEKARRAVAIVRRVARENQIQIPNCQFLTYYKT